MAVRLDATGLSKLEKKLTTYIELKGALSAAQAAVVFDGYLKDELSHPGTGRLYNKLTAKRNKKGRFQKRRHYEHRASAPGEPPAIDTGFLRASVTVETDLPGGAAQVEVTAPYAVPLELGAPEYGLQPRPFFRVALAKAREAMNGAAKRARPGKRRG